MIECYLNYIVDVVAVEIYNNDNCAILLLGHELIKPAQTTATYEMYIRVCAEASDIIRI